MHNYQFSNNGIIYGRISKPIARKAFNSGQSVMLCPVNIRPGFPWNPEIVVDPERLDDYDRNFDKVVNSFEFYNCGYPETGKYTAFYMPIRKESI